MTYNLGKIRELINEALADRELADLCFDEFPNVYRDFDGQSRSSKIRSLVEYASKQGQIDKLLKGIEQINPTRYNRYRNLIGAEIEPPQPAPVIAPPPVTTSPVSSIVPTKCILVLAANPTGTEKLDLKAEANKIAARLQEGEPGKDYFIRFIEQSMTEDLDKYLLEYKPIIVHFVGHGNSSGEMLFQNDRHEPQPVTPSAFANLFALIGETVECVVLNSCFSLEMAEALQPHVRCTIGMNAAIDDESAGVFAGGFYRGLASGLGYHKAFELGCNAIERLKLPDDDVPKFHCIDPIMYDSKKRVTRSDDDKATLYPVWYGTNRKLVATGDVSQGFGGERDSQIHYGCCQVAVPKSHKIGSTGSNFWKRLRTMTDDRLKLDRSSLQLLDENNFRESIKSALQERELDERSALVFIHGFNSFGFKEFQLHNLDLIPSIRDCLRKINRKRGLICLSFSCSNKDFIKSFCEGLKQELSKETNVFWDENIRTVIPASNKITTIAREIGKQHRKLKDNNIGIFSINIDGCSQPKEITSFLNSIQQSFEKRSNFCSIIMMFKKDNFSYPSSVICNYPKVEQYDLRTWINILMNKDNGKWKEVGEEWQNMTIRTLSLEKNGPLDMFLLYEHLAHALEHLRENWPMNPQDFLREVEDNLNVLKQEEEY